MTCLQRHEECEEERKGHECQIRPRPHRDKEMDIFWRFCQDTVDDEGNDATEYGLRQVEEVLQQEESRKKREEGDKESRHWRASTSIGSQSVANGDQYTRDGFALVRSRDTEMRSEMCSP